MPFASPNYVFKLCIIPIFDDRDDKDYTDPMNMIMIVIMTITKIMILPDTG